MSRIASIAIVACAAGIAVLIGPADAVTRPALAAAGNAVNNANATAAGVTRHHGDKNTSASGGASSTSKQQLVAKQHMPLSSKAAPNASWSAIGQARGPRSGRPQAALVAAASNSIRKAGTMSDKANASSVAVSDVSMRAAFHRSVDAEYMEEEYPPGTVVWRHPPFGRRGHLPAFFSAVGFSSFLVCTSFSVFSVLRLRFPTVYLGRLSAEDRIITSGFHSWLWMSMRCSITEVAASSGLDQAMVLEFTHLSMRVLLAVGFPLILVLGPLHMFFGRSSTMALTPLQGHLDGLVKLSMANVEDRHPWLYWVHSLVVWLVVVLTQTITYHAQNRFLARRQLWLKELPAPRATTILVDRIPPAYRSDAALKDYFDNAMSCSAVASAFVVKQTEALVDLTRRKDAAVRALQQARFKMQNFAGRDMRDAVDAFVKQRDNLLRAIEKERNRVRKETASPMSNLNTSSGFVTFKSRREADLALKMVYTMDEAAFEVCAAPDPTDVLYAGFQDDKAGWAVRQICGYVLFGVVALVYLPFVATIAGMADLNLLAGMVPFFMPLTQNTVVTAMWDGLISSMALHLFMSFAPSIFVGVLCRFFRLRAESELQQFVQEIFFRFQVAFAFLVVLVVAALVPVYPQVIDSPVSVMSLLASEMPRAAHFFLNFMAFQTACHTHGLLRLVPLTKFVAFRRIFEEETAKSLAEPEDQDYYGIGCRAAQMSSGLVICLVLGGFCPMLMPVGFASFVVCRLVYGYLIPFAETQKPDSGGRIWVTQLKQVHQSLVVYVVVTTFVLAVRDESMWPAVIAASCLIFQYFSFTQFDQCFKWETLSMDKILEADINASGPVAKLDRPTDSGVVSYEQPELSGQGDVQDLDVGTPHLGVKLAKMSAMR